MSGMINTDQGADQDPDQGASTGSSGLDNPLLQQTENGIEAKLKPEMRANYMKIVVAGLKIALSKGPQSMAATLLHHPDPIGSCAKGAVNLVILMRRESKGVMPMQAAIPAGLTLVLHGLDFIERAGIVKISEPEIVRATTIYTNFLFFRLKITPKMLQNATNRVHQIITDPDQMSKINLKAGLTKHPDAATPADIPGIPTGLA